jgi:hypothetical protein
MKLIQDLFLTDYGILSVLVLLFILVMAAWFTRFFMQKMNQKPGTK